jgi:hypothetical protein
MSKAAGCTICAAIPPPHQEANEVRARLIEDCQLLFCQEIGGPAAARLIRHRIHPMKAQPGTTIQAQCEAINTLLAGRLPPWLAKRLNGITLWKNACFNPCFVLVAR